MGNYICNLSDAEIEMFRDNWVNNKAADALAPCVTKSSATMVLTMQDIQVLAIHEKRFQQPAWTWSWEMIQNIETLHV